MVIVTIIREQPSHKNRVTKYTNFSNWPTHCSGAAPHTLGGDDGYQSIYGETTHVQ